LAVFLATISLAFLFGYLRHYILKHWIEARELGLINQAFGFLEIQFLLDLGLHGINQAASLPQP
jgi:hypothetical protein